MMNLHDLPITARAEIPEDYLDAMGHMNVMWYTHLFSRAAWGLFEQVGFSPEVMHSTHTGSFALEMHVRYLAEVRVGQHVTLRTRLINRTPKRLHYMHFLSIDERGDQLSATGELVSAHVDMRERKQSPFPDAIAQACDALLARHQALDWPAPVCGTMRA